MSASENDTMLLGKHTPVVRQYSPELLFPIAREEGRRSLSLSPPLPFHGVDLWHAYELSWLAPDGRPVVRTGRFCIPAESPCLIESKSLKLYLNSLNTTPLDSVDSAQALIGKDLSKVAGAEVSVEISALDDAKFRGETLDGICIDSAPLASIPATPSAELLRTTSNEQTQEVLYSHLLRSLCPVTGQPDWASVRVAYSGRRIEQGALLAYLVAYREHQEFHEQCVERIYSDIMQACAPEALTVQAFYTRRGGLDINPMRSTDATARPLPRTPRQ